MTRRAVVAGASGFVGMALVAALREEGYTVARIGRGTHPVSAETGGDAAPGHALHGNAAWGDAERIRRTVDGAELVVNLAGKSVNCRYTDANRDEILRSRVETTRQLRHAIAEADAPPALWLNASTATIYRYALDRPQDEIDGELGTGFSSDVARAWEEEFFTGDLPATRRAALRMAIVLGDGPATHLLATLARVGLGGAQHDGWWFPHRRYRGIGAHPAADGRAPSHRSRGRQRFSFIHIDDVTRAVRFIRDTPELDGPINLSTPRASDNRTLMAALRRVVGAPFGLPAARFMLEPAMWALRTEPELVLKSRWAVPTRLTQAGFTFAHPELEPALRLALNR